MVKLIRLKSQTDKLYFNNNIQSDLVLKPNSKIALQNVSFKKSDDTITINNSNNKMILNNDSFTSTIFLDSGTYNDINIKDLLIDMEIKLNSSLLLSEWNLGKSFDASISSQNFVTINTATGSEAIPATSSNFTRTGVISNSNGEIRKQSGTSEGIPDAYVGSERFFFNGTDGCGVFRVQLTALAATGSGFYIGLSTTAPGDVGSTLPLNDMTYAIYAENTATPYYTVRDEIGPVQSSEPIVNVTGGADNDYIEIGSYGGKIHLTVYNDNHLDGQALDVATAYSGGDALYPYIVFFDQSGCYAGETYYIGDPTAETDKLTLSNTDIIQPSLLGASNIVNQNRSDRAIGLEFDSLDLALQLGFSDSFILEVLFNLNWKAIRTVRYVDETECYLVEALNLQFNSYDGAKGQEKRRNLLAVIQNSRDRTAKDVLYDSNSPVYIDVNNINPLPLRNLQFRIINSDEGDVGALGNSNMTLLLE